MKNILVITYGSIDHASSRTRIIQYFDTLQANQFSIIHIPLRPILGKGILFILYRFLFKKFQSLKKSWCILFNKLDVVFVSRSLISNFDLFIIKRRKLRFIFDFDDAIYLGSHKKKERLARLLKYTSNIIVSSSNLNEFCIQNEVRANIVPTSVNTLEFYPNKNKKSTDEIIVGWIGSPSTEKYLFPYEKLFFQLSLQFPKLSFLFVGTSENFILNGVSMKKEKWSLEKEAELVRKMDIGIMPLDDNEWSKNKGGYKLYLYFSTGIPCIASPIGINIEIVEHKKNGFLATNEEEWCKYLTKLIESKELRRKFGEHGLNKCLEKYSKTTCEKQLLNILN